MKSLLISALALGLCAAQEDPNRDLKVEAAPRLEERRHALVIGNDRYPSAPLQNAANDARSMDLALSDLGFETLLVENAKFGDLERAVKRFAARVRPNDIALVFYAGHGFQIDGENYIVPVDFSSDDRESAKYSSYSANKLLDTLSGRNPKLLLVILDACRNNPFALTRNMGGGLASMGAAGKGTFIALATAPGATASDNPNGENGLFTTALLKYMKTKGMALTETFDEVKREVSVLSGNAQRPWTNSDFAGKWYFAPPDDYLPEEIDPSTSVRLLEEARRFQRTQYFNEAATFYERLAAREKDSPLGALASLEAGYLRALLANTPAVGAQPNPGTHAANLKTVWERIPARAAVGMESASHFLIDGNVNDAVKILGQLRAGDQDTAFRATEMLQELAKTFPEAAAVSAAKFNTLPPDPMTLKPRSRFEELAARHKAEKAAKLAAEANKQSILVPLGSLKSTLPPPTAEGWTIRLESLSKPVTPEPAPAPAEPEPAKPASRKLATLKVDIESVPAQAYVQIDDAEAPACQTPCSLELSTGPHTFVFKLPNHRPTKKSLEVSKTQTALAAELTPEAGEVLFSSTPSQAQIELNGKLLNLRTPAKVSLPPGEYAVSFWDGDVRVTQLQRFTLADAQTAAIQLTNQ
jgi:hypothetical protein